ncbi:MAG: sigma-70 family RNA polymerase sigma factor, partial [Planctomycetota bacterium]|nr:sigma-70 family RNA polymerase sigma factor [Planctomycetota bacterium]
MEATFDAVWHVKALAGDRQAVTQFARAATDPLYRFCLYRVGSNRHLCEDVVQETLVQAIVRLADYQPQRANNDIFPWLAGLARNEIRRAVANEKRAGSLETLWARMDEDMRHVLETLDRMPLSSEMLERDETREMVNATMSQLPAAYRAALEAKYVDNRTVRQTVAAVFVLTALAVSFLVLMFPSGHVETPRHAAVESIDNKATFPDVATAMHRQTADFAITPKRRAVLEPPKPAEIGQTISTDRGQRRRLPLPDGSVLFINQGTRVALVAGRRIKLEQGEIYVEVAPRNHEVAANGAATFLVETPDRKVQALGTKFSVTTSDAGTDVHVVQGKVKLDNLPQPLTAGQQFMPKPAVGRETAPHVYVARRASHVLDWTCDLMAKAESPLIPSSEYAGGAIEIIDPDGQKQKLSLRKYHVDVYIEDGFARTTIDQTYFNHLNQRLEGTFRFPLPGDASISRLAMYVAGDLMEGGMVERNYGRQVFESIKYRMLDPALLEWVDGSTFQMRVFPLEGRQEKRIVLSYTQRLNSVYGKQQYRFPAGHNLDTVRDWSTSIRVDGAADRDWHCDTHRLQAKDENGDLVLTAKAEDVAINDDLVIDLPMDVQQTDTPRFAMTRHESSQYLMVRYRPQLANLAVDQPRPR